MHNFRLSPERQAYLQAEFFFLLPPAECWHKSRALASAVGPRGPREHNGRQPRAWFAMLGFSSEALGKALSTSHSSALQRSRDVEQQFLRGLQRKSSLWSRPLENLKLHGFQLICDLKQTLPKMARGRQGRLNCFSCFHQQSYAPKRVYSLRWHKMQRAPLERQMRKFSIGRAPSFHLSLAPNQSLAFAQLLTASPLETEIAKGPKRQAFAG